MVAIGDNRPPGAAKRRWRDRVLAIREWAMGGPKRLFLVSWRATTPAGVAAIGDNRPPGAAKRRWRDRVLAIRAGYGVLNRYPPSPVLRQPRLARGD